MLHGGDVFEFWADNNHFERVVVAGDAATTVELIGSHTLVSTGLAPPNQYTGLVPNVVTLWQMQGVFYPSTYDAQHVFNGTDYNGGYPPQATNSGSGSTSTEYSDDIYAIYISHSDLTSRISIAAVPDLTEAPSRPMQPFTSAITLLVAPTGGGALFTTSVANTGNVLIGTRALGPQGSANITGFPTDEPIFTGMPIPPGVFSTLPASMSVIGAGITMAPGNNINSILIAGTILGTVNLGGSVQTFYAGWLETGNAVGEPGIGAIDYPDNFNVDGDIQTLITNGPVGTDTGTNSLTDWGAPGYLSGFDMHVGGRLGMFDAADASTADVDSLVGNIDVTNSPNQPSINGTPFQQIDVRGGDPFDSAEFGTDTTDVNDTTIAGAQILGTIDNTGDVVVDGDIQADAINTKDVDYYGVPLLAGQTITVQLTNGEAGIVGVLDVGVFDPEGRLVATDYSNVDVTQTSGLPFQVTAQMPGLYYFGVTTTVNNAFAEGVAPGIDEPYQLSISGVGNLGIGGIRSAHNMLDNPAPNSSGSGSPEGVIGGFHVEIGDFGAAIAGGLVFSDDSGLEPYIDSGEDSIAGSEVTFAVDNGSLRAVEGASLGNDISASTTSSANGAVNAGAYGEVPTCYVPNGNVGLLKASSTANAGGQGGTGILAWNQIIETFGVTGGLTELTAPQAAAVAIGGDYEMVDAANVFVGDLVAQGNIGTIRANTMDTLTPSYFQVNAEDDPSRHGVIDLIDVATNLGVLGDGGPAITTGPGGNVRYINVGPFGQVFRDAFFGGGTPENTLYQPGETASIVDDSGAVVSMTPQYPADSLEVTTYPIRGSGGSVIVKVEITDVGAAAANIANAGGINISTNGTSAEIGDIQIDGNGIAVTAPDGQTSTGTTTTITTTLPTTAAYVPPPLIAGPTFATTGTAIDINISGSAKTDVWDISGTPDPQKGDGSLVTGVANISAITNTTGGEIVNMHLSSVGTVTSNGTVGIPLERNTPAALMGNTHVPLQEDRTHSQIGNPWDYPFLQPSNMIRILGNVISISASQGVGNIYVGYVVQALGADTIPVVGTAPIPASSGVIVQDLAGTGFGEIGSISGPGLGPIVASGQIGGAVMQGMIFYGSGAMAFSGIFTSGVLGPVTIRGNDQGVILSVVGDDGVTINDGSLDQGEVSDFDRFDYAEQRAAGFQITGTQSPFTRPTLDIGPITVNGNGGIIGSFISGDHLGPINVSPSGFGVFDTRVSLLGDGTLVGLTASGYGIRDGLLQGGASIGSINAKGDGTELPVTNYSPFVRQSESGATFDPQTGVLIGFLDDIDTYLTTSAATPIVLGATESGVIEDLIVEGSRNVTSITAWSIRGRTLSALVGTNIALTPTETQINVANVVANVTVTGPVNGFAITTGKTSKYHFGGDVADFQMTVSGPVGNVVFNGSLLSNSAINATGPSGKIASIKIMGNFDGQITSTNKIGTINIYGSIIGVIKASSVGTLKVTGGLGDGSLSVTGNVGTIQTPGDLSSPGNTLTINGTLNALKVGGNLNASVSVADNLKQMLIGGSILSGSDVNVVNTLGLLKVGSDIQAGATVSAHIITRKLIKGVVDGIITTA